MMRFLKWFLGILFVLLIVVFIGVPLAMNTESGRKRVAEVIGKGLHRPVALDGMKVGLFFSSLGVEGLTVANPSDFPDGNLIEADSLALDSSLRRVLDGRVEGSVTGSGVRIHLIRKDGRTNLDGIGGPKDERAPTEPPPGGEEPPADEPAPPGGKQGPVLDLSLSVTDSQLIIEDLDKADKVVVDGVSIEMRFTNETGAPDTGLKIRIRAIEQDGLTVSDIRIDARQDGDWIDLQSIRAKLPGEGTLEGDGRLQLRGENVWNAELAAQRVTLDGDVAPFVASVYPIAASAGDQLRGVFDGTFKLKGRGLSWEVMKPTLTGDAQVRLSELQLPAGSLLVQAAELAGRAGGEPITLNSAGAQFGIADGWMSFSRLSASGPEARYDLAGRVSLDGKMELTMDFGPLVEQFGGGERYGKFKEYVDKLPPLRIEGTTSSPKLSPPTAEALKRSLLEGLGDKAGEELGGLIDKIGKR